MRTTLSTDDELMREARQRAAESGTTVSKIVEAAVRRGFAITNQAQIPRQHIRLLIDSGHADPGLQPGVDLDDSAGLLEIMESER